MEFDEFSPSPVLEDIHKYYVIDDEVLGRGQYGEVRKATHRQNKGSYVVKSILKQKIRRPEVLRKEMEFLLRVEHPNICNVVDVFDTRDAFHIVQDFYSGGELFDRIVETYNEGSHFSEEQVCEMVQHMLNGIEYCHETVGICHRDLKPENILFRSPDSLDLVIIDFGLSADVEVGAADGEGGGGAGGGGAAHSHKPQSDHMRSRVGTLYYMAPEIFTKDYGRACDLWSIGVITYVMMCGYPPFNGDDDREIMAVLKNPAKTVTFHGDSKEWARASGECKDFIRQLMSRDPAQRPTAREALEHPWFKKTHTPDLPLCETIGPSLVHFHHMSKLKRMAFEAAAHDIAETEEVSHLREIFGTIDTAHDGKISLAELKAAMPDWPADSTVKIDEIFKSLDLDGEGRINYLEFIAATVPPTVRWKVFYFGVPFKKEITSLPRYCPCFSLNRLRCGIVISSRHLMSSTKTRPVSLPSKTFAKCAKATKLHCECCSTTAISATMARLAGTNSCT